MSADHVPLIDPTALLIRRVLYPLLTLKNRSARLRYLAQLEQSQYWPTNALLEQQWALFKAMVAHAYQTCPYYRQTFRKAGFEPTDLRSRSDIDSVPTVSKEEIQEHWNEMFSSSFPKESLIRDMTGGSTGSPVQFYYDKDRLDSRTAATLRHNGWAGWEIGDRAAILWGAPQDTRVSRKLRDRIRTWIEGRCLILDASALTDAAMAEFARELVRYRPAVLQAYSNTLGLFAQYVQAEKIEGISPRGIVCSAEMLTDENRKLIEETFGCPVYNRYGCREFAVIASECDAHQGLHINAENLLVEVLRDGKSCVGKDGEIVITDLRNFAMPMIRYRIGDVGQIKQASCACARGLPLMEVVGGRVTDFLVATNGNRVSGIVIATYVITNIPGIRQIQLVQNEPGVVIINLVKTQNWTEYSMNELTTRMHHYLGEEIRLQVEVKDHIPLQRSGKYQFSICNV